MGISMRVYEFSKEHGLSNKELLDALHKAGFAVKNHMSALSSEAHDFLINNYIKKEQKKSDEAVSAKQRNTEKVSQENKAAAPAPKSKVDMKQSSIADNIPQKTPPSARTPAAEMVRESLAIVREPTVLADLAIHMEKPASELIVALLKWGILSNKNQLLPEEIVARLAEHYSIPVIEKAKEDKTHVRKIVASEHDLQPRLPVVVVLGHVDHGKTTLLDYIRKTRVAAKEKGGITQHLGAYEAHTKHGNIVFLDTPGHEAFSKIRSRGSRVADIAILVVAADDSIMPQTIEAIKHAKSAQLPIIVAINKIDKVDATRIERVKRDLAQYDLLPEEWGGSVICMPISAKLGQGVDQLLEIVALQSEIMELKTDLTAAALGYVLESKIEKGRGSVATVLLQRGTISIGDYFVCGKTGGKVSSIVDSHGEQRRSVGPSVPVQIAGFQELPQAGDIFEAVSKDDYRKNKALAHEVKIVAPKALVTQGAINLIVKTDTNSSKEALIESIAKLSLKSEKGFNIIYSGVGNINESDVALAADTSSELFGLHVKAEPGAISLAQKNSLQIYSFDIIYKLLEHIEKIAEAAKEVKMVKKKIGEAVVRKVFDIKNLGVIAGCYVREGIISREGTIVVWRGKYKIGEGAITSLQRDKKSVKEVHAGFECGFIVQGFTQWQEDDRAECFILVPAK
jgi:translation initiation factor IF-2